MPPRWRAPAYLLGCRRRSSDAQISPSFASGSRLPIRRRGHEFLTPHRALLPLPG
jgi:hypothetical protein